MKIEVPQPKFYFEFVNQLELRICKLILACLILTIQTELKQVSSQIVDFTKRLFQINIFK